jgi:hypothetical protein
MAQQKGKKRKGGGSGNRKSSHTRQSISLNQPHNTKNDANINSSTIEEKIAQKSGITVEEKTDILDLIDNMNEDFGNPQQETEENFVSKRSFFREHFWSLILFFILLGVSIDIVLRKKICEDYFIIVGLIFSLAIFFIQELNQKRQRKYDDYKNYIEKKKKENREERKVQIEKREKQFQEEILKRIDENILGLQPIQEIKSINKKLHEWLEEENNLFIFFFPYSIYPGFWIDGGYEFKAFLHTLDGIFANKRNSYTNKFIFIGPSADEKSSFGILCKNIKDNNYIEKLDTNFRNYVGINISQNGLNKSVDQITRQYKLLIENLKELEEKNKLNVKVTCLNEIDLTLPSSSFVIKLENTGKTDLFYIDTFDFLSKKINEIQHNFGLNSIDDIKSVEQVIKNPKSHLIQNTTIAKLYASTFIEICCNSNELKDVKSKIFQN